MKVNELPQITPWYVVFYSTYEMEKEVEKEIKGISDDVKFGGQGLNAETAYLPVKKKLYGLMNGAYALNATRNKNATTAERMKVLKFALPFVAVFVCVFMYGIVIGNTGLSLIGILIGLLPFFFFKLCDRMFHHAVEMDKKFFEGQVHYCWKNGVPLK